MFDQITNTNKRMKTTRSGIFLTIFYVKGIIAKHCQSLLSVVKLYDSLMSLGRPRQNYRGL